MLCRTLYPWVQLGWRQLSTGNNSLVLEEHESNSDDDDHQAGVGDDMDAYMYRNKSELDKLAVIEHKQCPNGSWAR